MHMLLLVGWGSASLNRTWIRVAQRPLSSPQVPLVAVRNDRKVGVREAYDLCSKPRPQTGRGPLALV